MKKFAGISLLIIGSIVLLVHFGHIFLLVLMGGLLFFGWKKWKHAHTKQDRNKAYLAWGLAALCCLFNAPFLFMLLIGCALMYFGWKLTEAKSTHTFAVRSTSPSKSPFDNSFDADWKEFVDKNKTH